MEIKMFKVMLDTYAYSKKPSPEETARYINSRIMKYPIEITAENLAMELSQGKTFIPAYIGGTVELDKHGKSKRSPNNWTSQQIVCLDFDNEIMIPDPDNSKKKIKKKEISLSWDQAKSEFKDSALFMYKSFSNTDDHPKFRVVFAFDSVINDKSLYLGNANFLLNKYPYADQSSVQENRLFYGGTESYVFNYANRLQVDKTKKLEDGGFCDLNSMIIKQNNNIGREYPLTPKESRDNNNNNTNITNKTKYEFNHVQLLRNKDKHFAKLTGIQQEELTFTTKAEAYDYLKNYNLHDYLGITDNTIHDIFHEDTHKSASIFQSNKSGYWFYKCHSESNKWTGTIIDLTERLTGLSKPKSFRYLCEIFNIHIELTDWQKEQEENFKHNLDFIVSESTYIAEAYPNLHYLIGSPDYFQVIREFHLVGLDVLQNLIKLDEHDNGVFFASIKHILKRIYGEYIDFDKYVKSKEKRVRTTISLLVFLELLERHDLNSLPEVYSERAKAEAKSKRHKYTIEFYSIPSYDANMMIKIEKIAKRFREIGMTVGNFDRQMVLQSCGQEVADKCFPNRKEEKISDLNEKTCKDIEKIVLQYLDEYGWVTEERIIRNVPMNLFSVEDEMRKRNRKIKKDDIISEGEKDKWIFNYKKSQLKKVMGGLLTRHNLKREPLSNELMRIKDIPQHYSEKGFPSYPVIIHKI